MREILLKSFNQILAKKKLISKLLNEDRLLNLKNNNNQ